MKSFFVILLLLVMFTNQTPNLFIGTSGSVYGCGSNSPAAQVPYSYVRLGPDTSPKFKEYYINYQHYGGYDFQDNAIRAFSHMHLVGAGILDMGILGILPISTQTNYDEAPQPVIQRLIEVDKQSQKAEPGYYTVNLPIQDIKAELTTSQRCGAHRYTNEGQQDKTMEIHIMTSYLLQRSSPRDTNTTICGEKCIEGSIKVTGGFGRRFGGYTVHYHLEWKQNLSRKQNENINHQEIFLYKDSSIFTKQTKSVNGYETGAILRTKSKVIQIYVGLSYVSIQNAKLNFENQIKGKSFDQIRQQSNKVWQQQFSRFNITAVDSQTQTKIDSAVYRTLLSPTIFQDSNGQYLSFANDGSVELKPSNMDHVYTDLSLWDVHRTQFPWILFHDRERYNDIVKTIVLINREGGYMPMWTFAQGATSEMIGAHANTVLADWVVKEGHKNMKKQDISQILQFMLRNANTETKWDSRYHPDTYIKLGYIPYDNIDDKTRACPQTLQYSYNDFGISQVAKILNQTQIEKQFVRRSKFYKNVWNQKTKFFDPRNTNGQFQFVSDLERTNKYSQFYVEGDAWHYRFYAPHDAEGLVQLFGGEKSFIKELKKFFTNSYKQPSFAYPNSYYWHGNEHNLFSVWLFALANHSHSTERFSRQIIDTHYGTSANGLPGQDDYGTLSSWLIWACLGFYPLPSTEKYILGSPYIKQATILRKTQNKQTSSFRIIAYDNSKDKVSVKNVKLNGQNVKTTINHGIFGKDTLLEFRMKQ